MVNYSKPCDLWDTLQVTKAQKFGGLSQKLSAFERKKERKKKLFKSYLFSKFDGVTGQFYKHYLDDFTWRIN